MERNRCVELAMFLLSEQARTIERCSLAMRSLLPSTSLIRNQFVSAAASICFNISDSARFASLAVIVPLDICFWNFLLDSK